MPFFCHENFTDVIKLMSTIALSHMLVFYNRDESWKLIHIEKYALKYNKKW